MTRRVALRIGVFTGKTTGVTTRCRAGEKNYAPEGFTDVLAAPAERKTCESVPSDSRTQVFGVCLSALGGSAAREIFNSDFGLAVRCQSATTTATPRRGTSRSETELLLEQVIDGLRVGLAARRLHHLADEPADRLRVGFGVGDLVGVSTDDVVDDLLDRPKGRSPVSSRVARRSPGGRRLRPRRSRTRPWRSCPRSWRRQ